MSWKKTEHFKETEFGPMKTGHTIEHTDCVRCNELRAKLAAAERDLSHMTLDRDMFSDRANFLVKKRDELRKQLDEMKLDNYDVSKIIQRKKVEPQITELQAHADALAELVAKGELERSHSVGCDGYCMILDKGPSDCMAYRTTKVLKAYREFRDQGLR